MDALVADKILSYLHRIDQVSIARGLGTEAVKIIQRYHLRTEDIESGKAYHRNQCWVDVIYLKVRIPCQSQTEGSSC